MHQQSTVSFKPGILIQDRTPPPALYFNLMKCVWILRMMQGFEEVKAPSQGSHWPRFIYQLRQVSFYSCSRAYC